MLTGDLFARLFTIDCVEKGLFIGVNSSNILPVLSIPGIPIPIPFTIPGILVPICADLRASGKALKNDSCVGNL